MGSVCMCVFVYVYACMSGGRMDVINKLIAGSHTQTCTSTRKTTHTDKKRKKRKKLDWRKWACITSGSWVHKLVCVCMCVSVTVRGWLAGIPCLPLPAATVIAFLLVWTCVTVLVELHCLCKCVGEWMCVFHCQAWYPTAKQSISHTHKNKHTQCKTQIEVERLDRQSSWQWHI